MISMWKVREMVDKATNIVMNYTETEAKVRDATNDDPWGPSGQQMQELASFTFTYEQFPEVMGMLWKRMLQDNRANWRRTYKSLLLLDYLIKNGSERVVTSAREHVYDLRSMENYAFIDENGTVVTPERGWTGLSSVFPSSFSGKDQGVNIRHKVTDMIDFIQDDDRLRDERKKAKKNKDKYVGLSNDSMGYRSRSGFDSWQDRWASGNTSSSDGTGGGGGGFRDHSPSDFDDQPRRHSPIGQQDDFRDEDDPADDDGFGELSRQRAGGGVAKATTTTTTKQSVAATEAVEAKPKQQRVRKPIDLGAAATFAQTAQVKVHLTILLMY